MQKRVVILGSFDTKGEELRFLKQCIRGGGCAPVCVDTSLGGEPAEAVDIASREVAAAAGVDIAEIRASRDTGKVTRWMIQGASSVVGELHSRGELDGIISIGGASNTGLATAVMGALPFGVPKIMVSSMAAVPAYAGSYFGTRDITMIHSVVDVAGLNPLLESVLRRAAGALCGMVMAGAGAVDLGRGGAGRAPRVAVTEFKFSEACCRHAINLLTAAGVQVVPFHANGVGDRALEELIGEGLVDAVLDVVPAGVAEELLGGNRAAGPDRLVAASRKGIPQVIAPSGFDMLSCGPLERGDRGDPLWVRRGLSKRRLFVPDALRVQARTSAEELAQVAEVVAGKLSCCEGRAVVLIPTRGWSSLSEEGMPLCDFDADAAFTRRLNECLEGPAEVREVDLPLNGEAFARLAVGELLGLLGDGAVPARVAS